MSAALQLFPDPVLPGCQYWARISKGDTRGRVLADRHYTRQSPGHPMWTRPGYNACLWYGDEMGDAVFVWWRPKWEAGVERRDGLRALECTIFRNESGVLSSTLIRDAARALGSRRVLADLALPSARGLACITGIGSTATRRRRSRHRLPGACFRSAGWHELDHAKGRADIWLTTGPQGEA